MNAAARWSLSSPKVRTNRNFATGDAKDEEFDWALATEPARNCISLAEKEARGLAQPEIDTDHLLLALLDFNSGWPAEILAEKGIDPAGLRKWSGGAEQAADEAKASKLPFSRAATQVITEAFAESATNGDDYMGTTHLLVGLLGNHGGFALPFLTHRDVDIESLRESARIELGVDPESATSMKFPRASSVPAQICLRCVPANSFCLLNAVTQVNEDEELAGQLEAMGIASETLDPIGPEAVKLRTELACDAIDRACEKFQTDNPTSSQLISTIVSEPSEAIRFGLRELNLRPEEVNARVLGLPVPSKYPEIEWPDFVDMSLLTLELHDWMDKASVIAGEAGRGFVDTDSFLLALIDTVDWISGLLAKNRIDRDEVKEWIDGKKCSDVPDGVLRLPIGAIAQLVVEDAFRESQIAENDHVGVEHVLMALLGNHGGLALAYMTSAGLENEETRARLSEKAGNKPDFAEGKTPARRTLLSAQGLMNRFPADSFGLLISISETNQDQWFGSLLRSMYLTRDDLLDLGDEAIKNDFEWACDAIDRACEKFETDDPSAPQLVSAIVSEPSEAVTFALGEVGLRPEEVNAQMLELLAREGGQVSSTWTHTATSVGNFLIHMAVSAWMVLDVVDSHQWWKLLLIPLIWNGYPAHGSAFHLVVAGLVGFLVSPIAGAALLLAALLDAIHAYSERRQLLAQTGIKLKPSQVRRVALRRLRPNWPGLRFRQLAGKIWMRN